MCCLFTLKLFSLNQTKDSLKITYQQRQIQVNSPFSIHICSLSPYFDTSSHMVSIIIIMLHGKRREVKLFPAHLTHSLPLWLTLTETAVLEVTQLLVIPSKHCSIAPFENQTAPQLLTLRSSHARCTINIYCILTHRLMWNTYLLVMKILSF